MTNHATARALPPELQALTDLSLDLRWTGSQLAGRIWEQLDPEAWDRIKNPGVILMHAELERLTAAATDERLLAQLAGWLERRKHYTESPGWFGTTYADAGLKHVAYFSMEFGLGEALPIYSGGLGILAGDHMKSASDLAAPVVGIGLLYQQGYFRQVLGENGWQLEAFPYNDPGSLPVTPVRTADGRWPRVRLELPGRTLLIRPWQARVGRTLLYLLDSNDPLNSPWDRGITANLYAAGKDKRLLQELILGVGGWRLLEDLGVDVQVCHLNEGHAAFAVIARAASFARANRVPFDVALWATRAGNVFTTHTPVEAAFDQFDPALLLKYAQPFFDQTGVPTPTLLGMGRRDPQNQGEPFNMAYLAMRGCARVNGVSKLHGKVSQRLFKPLFAGWPEAEIPVGAVTNGVHVPSWDSVPANHVWTRAHGDRSWIEHLPEAAQALAKVSPLEIWDFRAAARKNLVDYVRRRFARQEQEHGAAPDQVRRARHVLDPNTLTLGFARRFTAYKRPNLLLHDEERLTRVLTDPARPVQLLIAGKAHPDDTPGKGMVQTMARFAMRPDLRDRVVFLEDYDIALAQEFAAGVDVWVNNPRRPAEACGTSGMKMLVNGGLNLSVLDGWWDEAYTPDVGWAIGTRADVTDASGDRRDAEHLYDLLENHVVPEFYTRDPEGVPLAWVERIRASMATLTAAFSSSRMVRDYVEKAYIPASAAFLRRSANGGQLARKLCEWSQELAESWRGFRFDEVRVTRADDVWNFEVRAYLGDLGMHLVRLELYAEPATPGDAPLVIPLELKNPIAGSVNGHVFTGQAPATRPADHYTPRIVPSYPDALFPLEDQHIAWK